MRTLKNIELEGWLILGIAICFALFSILVSFASHQDHEGPWYDDIKLTCVYGNINNKGRVEDVKTAMFTEDLILCSGYRITLPYNSNYYYEVHYFTSDDRWISGEYRTESGVYVVEAGSFPSLINEDGTIIPAAGIRIVLVQAQGKNIGFWEKLCAHNVLTLDVFAEERPIVDNVIIPH